MARTFGRVTVDDRGIRQKPFLLFFGSRFDLAWADIRAWATVEAVLGSAEGGTVIARILELHTADNVHSIQRSGSDAGFGAMVEEVRRQLPDKQTKSILAQMRPEMYR
jgi:hypothetical protein